MGDGPNQDIQKDLTKIEGDINKGNWSSAYPEIEKVAATKEGRTYLMPASRINLAFYLNFSFNGEMTD